MSRTIIEQDLFDGPQLNADWQGVRAQAEDVQLAAGELLIRVRPGSIYGPVNDAVNLFIRPLPEQAAGAEVHVSFKLVLPFEQAGLLWYYDDDNYIKLVLEMIDGERNVVMVREEKAEAGLVGRTVVDTDQVQLRLTAVEGVVTADYLTSEETGWQLLATCPAFAMDGLHAGIFGHGGSDEEKHMAAFSKFAVFQ